MYMEKLSALETQAERRRKPRINHPFGVKVSGRDTLGEAFAFDTVIDNMSSTGIFLKLPRDVSFGAKVSMLVRLSTRKQEDLEVANVSLEAVVIRKELLQDESWGLAFLITRRRFV
jgi:hypothetical protein